MENDTDTYKELSKTFIPAELNRYLVMPASYCTRWVKDKATNEFDILDSSLYRLDDIEEVIAWNTHYVMTVGGSLSPKFNTKHGEYNGINIVTNKLLHVYDRHCNRVLWQLTADEPYHISSDPKFFNDYGKLVGVEQPEEGIDTDDLVELYYTVVEKMFQKYCHKLTRMYKYAT